jgi:hypothetical protein
MRQIVGIATLPVTASTHLNIPLTSYHWHNMKSIYGSARLLADPNGCQHIALWVAALMRCEGR